MSLEAKQLGHDFISLYPLYSQHNSQWNHSAPEHEPQDHLTHAYKTEHKDQKLRKLFGNIPIYSQALTETLFDVLFRESIVSIINFFFSDRVLPV